MRGTVGLTGAQRLDLAVDANAVDLQTLLRAANQQGQPVSGTLAGHGTVSGTIARPLVSLTLEGADLVAFEETFGSLTANVGLAGRDVTLSRLTIDKPQPGTPGRITATGGYNLDRRAYTVDLQSQNVTLLGLALPGGQRVRGDVQVVAKGAGTVAAPAGTANLTIDSLEIDGAPAPTADGSASAPSTSRLGRVVIAATAANGKADIQASAPIFNVDGDAVIGLARPWPATATVRANDLDLAKLPVDLQTPLTGQLRATVEATGDLADPTRGQATANISSFNGSWNQQPFSVTSPSRLRYANERLDVERLQLTARDSTLVVSGQLPLTERAGTGEITVDAKANLATLAQYLPADTNITGDGAVSLTGTLRGTLKAIDPDLVLTVENGLILSPQIEPGLSNVRLRARVANGAADIEQLAANWGSATIDASGRIPLEVVPPLPVEIPRTGGPATIKASIKNLDPAAIPGAPAGLSGHIALDAQVSATRADLAALDGRISFPQLDVTFNGLTLAQQQPSAIAIGSGAATVERLELSGSAGSLAASGTVGLVGERPIDLNVDGNLQLAALSALTDQVRMDGAATVKLAAQGTVAAPSLNGTVALADATAVSDAPNIAAENISASVQLAGNRMELTTLRADVNGGTLDGSGAVTLAAGSVSDIDLQFTTKDFAYDAPLDLRSVSDSSIRVDPPWRRIPGDRAGDDRRGGADRRHQLRRGPAGGHERAADARSHRRAQPSARAGAVQRRRRHRHSRPRRQQPGACRDGRGRAGRRHAVPARAHRPADAARGRGDHAERAAVRSRARHHHVRGRAPHLPVVRPAAQHHGRAATTSRSA